MSRSYKIGLSLGEWLREKRLWSERAHHKAITAFKTVGDYIWLIAGLLLIWVGLIGIYVIHSTGMPSSPVAGLFIAPFCLYRFVKLRGGWVRS